MAQPTVRPPALDAETVEVHIGTPYPPPFDQDVGARQKRRLGDALGLTNFGVNLVRQPPGCVSSQRHWHTLEDEFIYVLEGELVLVSEAGEQMLGPGMAAGFPAGKADGHQLVNRSDRDAVYLEVGDRRAGDATDYPDIDMRYGVFDGVRRFVHKDGTPY